MNNDLYTDDSIYVTIPTDGMSKKNLPFLLDVAEIKPITFPAEMGKALLEHLPLYSEGFSCDEFIENGGKVVVDFVIPIGNPVMEYINKLQIEYGEGFVKNVLFWDGGGDVIYLIRNGSFTSLTGASAAFFKVMALYFSVDNSSEQGKPESALNFTERPENNIVDARIFRDEQGKIKPPPTGRTINLATGKMNSAEVLRFERPSKKIT